MPLRSSSSATTRQPKRLHTILNATCELTGALRCEEVLRLPAHDVLPFENLSPHAEIQEGARKHAVEDMQRSGPCGDRTAGVGVHAPV